MKGNLTIDNGNTSVKVAFFIGTQVVATNRFIRRDARLLERFISTYKPDTAIVCSTASSAASQRIEQLANERCRRALHLTHETCFVGGNIAPGLALRFKALHEHTGRLPLIQPEGDTPMVGYDTETAIRSGVMLGLLGEVRSYIADLKLSHPSLMVFITGGDGKWLHSKLADKNIIYSEHLAAEGLNRILLYNQANGNI